jgi:hypothetical protein
MRKKHDETLQVWANRLKHLGVGEVAAALLEATGPLNLVGAQLIYLSQPLLGNLLDSEHLDALATLLEDSDETQAFVSYLREVTA